MSERGLQLGTEFRYLLPHGRGNLQFTYLPSDNLTEREHGEEIADGIPEDNRRVQNRGMLRFNATQDLSDHWEARSNLYWISDPRWLEDSSNNINGLSAYRLTSSIGLYGTGRYWQAGISAERSRSFARELIGKHAKCHRTELPTRELGACAHDVFTGAEPASFKLNERRR